MNGLVLGRELKGDVRGVVLVADRPGKVGRVDRDATSDS